MKNIFWKNFFREDLNLKNRWWHRLFFCCFVVAFVWISWATISSMLDDAQLPKYTKVGMLSDRMDSEVRLIGDLVKPEEKIAVYEGNLYGAYQGKSFYDGNGGYLLKQEYYCSKNVSDQIEKITTRTKINSYKGNIGLVSLSEFKNYLSQNKAECVEVLDLDSVEHFGNTKKALSLGFEADNMAVWKESSIKSILFIFLNLIYISFGFFIIIVLYYKIFLYIIFGKK